MHLPTFRSPRAKLRRAIRRNDARKITHILSSKSLSPTSQHLVEAISSASHSALEALLDNHDPAVPKSPRTPDRAHLTHETLTPALHAAAATPDPKALSILLSSGARVRALHKGREPLHLAIRAGARKQTQPEVLKTAIRILVSAGALKGQFEEHLYPPNYAITHNNVPALYAMLSHPSPTLVRSLRKYSTLRYACSHASLDVFQTLFRYIDQG